MDENKLVTINELLKEPPLKISFSEANKLTDETIKQHRETYEEIAKNAIEEAVNEVTKDSFQKIKEACTGIMSQKKKRYVEIYSFHYVKDKTATHDIHGNKVIFNGVRFSNILKYNHKRFISTLEDFFNQDSDDNGKFYCYYRISRVEDDTKWSIYVAWNQQKPKTNFNEEVNVKRITYSSKKKMIDETNHDK